MFQLNKKKLLLFIAVIIIIFLFLTVWINFISERDTDIKPVEGNHATIVDDDIDVLQVSSVAINLKIPWDLDFFPDGSIIFTERPGKVYVIDQETGLLKEPILTLDNVEHIGEGGLLGIALHPSFKDTGFVYLYYTYKKEDEIFNRVVRYKMDNSYIVDVTQKKIIIDKIPGARTHNGGRIDFGPDENLYVTTGDAAQPKLSQDMSSLAGKILRVKDDGKIPSNNPFNDSPVYSLGHRNPQGLAWDSDGNLWSTEHGAIAKDELNLIEAGKNYGWPIIEGDETHPNMESPILQSGRDTWAPSGATYYNGSIYFAGLRGQTLYQAKIDSDSVELFTHFDKEFGRLRSVFLGPDNNLYVLTSNRDGRGVPVSIDDQIIRINPEKILS
ncbi:PQQ-dependent sugar dehydrogenase [Methanosalsum natronophilum]|uniref:PQQ-dependent sugar dehydrogenase n=1 Tax=Methanosalsum natronophilum TaxID=768733 RepID=UPI0021691B18|nr:PQQ-dependent sugar dehydrogenase [Methanosalsum natronophilum]MCS3924158.1 glucose/arabinose dehydrogenase [Methanosalsum natronophilum]